MLIFVDVVNVVIIVTIPNAATNAAIGNPTLAIYSGSKTSIAIYCLPLILFSQKLAILFY